MKGLRSILLFAIRPLIWPSETLAVTVPMPKRSDIDQTRNGAAPLAHREVESGLGSDPVEKGHDQHHDAHFFEATEENIKASNFGAAYASWVQRIDKNSTAWRERLSEPDYFAKDILDWPDDVNCGIAYNGCDARPLCDDIIERVKNRTRARQICYIFDSFHHVSLISAQIHVGVLSRLVPHSFVWLTVR